MFSFFLDLLVPPRPTERLVGALTLDNVRTLAESDGTLPYNDPAIQALVWELKYYANRRAAALAGAYIADEVLARASEELGIPILIPAPMHSSRLKERGHDHTALLCQAALPRLAGAVAYAPKCLHKIRQTRTQQGLERTKRLRNVHTSMRAESVEGRVCIVVDDVTTTGATFAECTRALMAAGARSVYCIALARS